MQLQTPKPAQTPTSEPSATTRHDHILASQRDQTPTQAGLGNQTPTPVGLEDQTGLGNQTPTPAGLEDQTPTQAGLGNQTPTSAGLGDQTPNENGETVTPVSDVSQEGAIRAVMEGTLFERTRIAGRALRALLKDPEQTEMVFVLGIAINRGRIGELLGQFVGSDSGNWLLEHKPSINSTAIDFDWLRQLPKGTLGREYVSFLDRNNLDADFFEEPPGLSPMLRFVVKRMRQSHDVWHTVTGYSTEPAGEVELQAFTYGQIGVPSAVLIAITGSIRGMRTDVGLPLRALRAYRRGRAAQKFAPFLWENHWERSLDELRAELECSAPH